MKQDLTHISLFAGIGGDTLASEWAGFKTILLCEIDPFCQQVLKKNFPGVPIIGDVHDVTKETVIANTDYQREQQPEGSQPDIGRRAGDRGKEAVVDTEGREVYQRIPGNMEQKAEGRQGLNATVGNGNQPDGIALTLLTAGVPCQPASIAGKRRGKADDRWLWTEAIRVLSELKPAWAVFENPAGIGSLGELGGLSEMGNEAVEEIPDREAVELDNICRDIEACGYEVQPVCIPACAVGAPHRRDRIFIIAHNISKRRYATIPITKSLECDFRESKSENNGWQKGNQPDTHTQKQGPQGAIAERGICRGRLPAEYDSISDWSENWIEVATRFCRVDAGVSNRIHRLKALGNAIVPQQIYPILQAIAESEILESQA